jgi:general secretion pathway protein E
MSLDTTALEKLAKQLGLPFELSVGDPSPPRDLVRGDFDRIAGSWGRQFMTVPIRSDENGITVATANPLYHQAIDQLRLCYEKPIHTIVTTPDEISRVINAIRTTLMSDRSNTLSSSESGEEIEDFDAQLKIDVTDSEDDDAPIIRYVNAIIFKANSERASDVHIEPFEHKLKVRFRVDGRLFDVASEDKAFQASIISRVKVMSGLNIAEKRLPQDGRIGLKIAGRDVDIRVSTIPTQFGERIVMRLLDKTATVLDLVQVGLDGKNFEILSKLIEKPNGIILVTGPTGSGKTTTLYSCISRINTSDLNILTVEDPIEYQLDGVGQMQVNPKINFTFANGLRAILRQDPDVVMVGEIRDTETAEIAIQASLTGHLVLSTIHTNDAAGAITRLLDMGIEAFLVSSSLLAATAQRLVRRLCPVCKSPYTISDEEIRELGVSMALLKGKTVYAPGEKDCTACQNTRYVGRTGIHEVLLLDDAVRSLILQRVDSNSIRQAAMKNGFETLRYDGAHKILQGVTSVHEVLLATHDDNKESVV